MHRDEVRECGLAARDAREALERAEKATEGPWCIDHGRVRQYRPDLGLTIHDIASMSGSRSWAADAEFIAAARSDVPRLARAVIAVAELHRPVTAYPGGVKREVCEECHYPTQFGVAGAWPCATIRALSDALEVEA